MMAAQTTTFITMRKCFECLAQGHVDPQDCVAHVKVVAKESGVGMWAITQACANGVVSLVTEVVGDHQTALDYADAIVSRRPLRPVR